ncbi:MAG: SAM-dependent methyltransferase [Bacteroidetes bacterium]|nr:SAM-dependent methyltransferase [Bacteroidota bacterium]
MQLQTKGILYLIPNFLDETNTVAYLQPRVADIVSSVNHFIGETEKNIRAFVKKVSPLKVQAELEIELLNEHNAEGNLRNLIAPLLKGKDIGLLSDAGMPCIADPGHQLVRLCHENGITVVPLAGPSSILLTLVASGFSGQQFTFHGYLPYDKVQRQKRIKQMEVDASVKNYTQLFMEAPYRNNQLLKELMEIGDSKTQLCAGIALTSPQERILTQSIAQWRKTTLDLHKIAVMFAMGK